MEGCGRIVHISIEILKILRLGVAFGLWCVVMVCGDGVWRVVYGVQMGVWVRV